MIAGLAWMLLANAGCLLAAHRITMRLRTGHLSVDAGLFLLVRFALASGAVLAAGLLGVLNGPALGLLGAAVLAVLLLARAHRDVRLPDLSAVRREIPPLLLFAAGVFLLRLILQAWFLAPHVGDAVCYHLPKVAEWVQAGAITRETGVDYRSPFPGGFELFEIWWTVFLHHDVLIEMAGVEMWLLAFASVHALARWTGLSVRDSFVASLLFSSTPLVLMQAVSCLNDLPVVALFLVTAALIVRRVPPLLLVLPLGVGIGVKPTFGFAVPGLLLLALLVRKEPGAPSGRMPLMAGCALLGLGLGVYWYVRNAVLYGNPIYPGGSQGFILPNQKLVQQVGPSLLSLKENLRRLIDSRIYDHLLGYNPTSEMTAGWGPVVFACGLPALLILLRSPGRFRTLAAGFGAAMISVFTLVLSDMWFTRFVLFVPVIPCIAAAALAPRLRGLPVLIGLLVAVQFVTTLCLDRYAVGEYPAMVRQGWRERAPEMIGGIPREPVPVACLQRGGLFIYLLYRPDYSRPVHYIRSWDPAEIVAEMRRRGIPVIYGSREASSILEGCVRQKLLKPMIGRFYALP